MSTDETRARIRELSREARVVLVRSSITDMRDLTERLGRAGVSWRELPMPMADAGNRAAFQMLSEHTGRHTLPQCFVDGEFVGGPWELLQRLGLELMPAGGSRVQWLVRMLGYAGLLPLAVGGLCVLLGLRALFGIDMLVLLGAWAAVTLSFVGAVHWGVALTAPLKAFRARLLAGISVVPAIVGWLAMLLLMNDPVSALLLLALGFAGWYAYEGLMAGPKVLPAWYLRQRFVLTGGTVAILLLAWLRLVLPF